MNLDELLAEPIEVKFLRTWREQAYQRGIRDLENHLKYHGCTLPLASGYCSIYPIMQKNLDKELQEYSDKIQEYLNKK